MGEVIGIGAARSLRDQASAEFEAAIEQQGSSVLLSLSDLTNANMMQFELPEVRVERATRTVGGVSTISSRTTEPVITSTGFPKLIANIPEIGSRAMVFCAEYVVAYGIAANAARAVKMNRRPEGIREELWPVAYRGAEHHHFEMPYRFAARVALYGQGIESLAVPDRIPEDGLPPHIASLYDPYSVLGIREFSTALVYTRDYQKRRAEQND